MLGMLLLLLYALFILAVTFRIRGVREPASFFVNNRTASARQVALSIIVSCIGASATIGVVGKAFQIGLPAFWWLGAGSAGLLVLALFLAEKVRESGAYTLPQMAETFLGPKARPLISLCIVVAWMGILAAQFSALEQVLISLTGWPPAFCLGLAFALIAMHSLGGQAAIMRLDSLQSLVMIAGLVIVLAWLWVNNPAWTSGVAIEAVNDSFGYRELVYYLLIVGGNYLVCPMLFGRFFSARDARTARRGGLYAAFGLALCSLLIVSIGLAGVGLIPGDTRPDEVFTGILGMVSPEWLQPLILVALVSAIVSSADTCLLTATTVFCHDLVGSGDMRVCRYSLLGLAFTGLLLSCLGKGILELLLMAYDIYVCGVVVPVFIGLLAKRCWCIASRHACAAIIAGGVCGGMSAVTGDTVYSYLGMALAAGISLAGLRRHTVAVI